jgi:phosphoribosylglycinamide formyltransferase 1
MKIVVMASTNGTDLQAIIDAIKNKKLNVKLKLVLSNKECYAIKRAKKEGFETKILKPLKDENREDYDKKCSKLIGDIDLIVLVGYMRLFSKWFVEKYKNKIINIHPSLLPSFPGMDLDVHKEVLNYGCKISGCTIHFVDEGMDSGAIIAQECVKISNGENIESLKKKVQDIEKKLYVEIIQKFVDKKIKIDGKKVIVGD